MKVLLEEPCVVFSNHQKNHHNPSSEVSNQLCSCWTCCQLFSCGLEEEDSDTHDHVTVNSFTHAGCTLCPLSSKDTQSVECRRMSHRGLCFSVSYMTLSPDASSLPCLGLKSLSSPDVMFVGSHSSVVLGSSLRQIVINWRGFLLILLGSGTSLRHTTTQHIHHFPLLGPHNSSRKIFVFEKLGRQ